MLVVWEPMERWEGKQKREMERRSWMTESGDHVRLEEEEEGSDWNGMSLMTVTRACFARNCLSEGRSIIMQCNAKTKTVSFGVSDLGEYETQSTLRSMKKKKKTKSFF
jgi:hypothetical protein